MDKKFAALEADIERVSKILRNEFDRGSKADLEFCKKMADEICPEVETHCDTVPLRISCIIAAKLAYLENAGEDQSDCEFCHMSDLGSKGSCNPRRKSDIFGRMKRLREKIIKKTCAKIYT